VGKTTPYDTTKAAMAGLTRGMAMDHAADGIRVNAVCPGPTLASADASFVTGTLLFVDGGLTAM